MERERARTSSAERGEHEPTYIADQSWLKEHERLKALEGALDPHSKRYLQMLGVRPGLACLEVGAGSGSIARWLAEQVTESGSVVATDLDTTLFAELARSHPQVRVVCADIMRQVPERPDGGGFDLAHARLVLGHVVNPALALANIVRALAPGGVLLIEETDFLWTQVGEQPLYPEGAMAPYFRVWRALVSYMSARGYDVHWGRKLVAALRTAGLEQVRGESLALIGDVQLMRAMRLTIERFAPELLRTRRIDPRDLAACCEAMDDPSTIFTGSPMFSVWGRKPS